MKNFWTTLPKPFFALAPLADVTDAAFRRIIAKYGKPDIMYTEFVSADGLFKGGYDALIGDLAYTDVERPIVAQFFTKEPEMMQRAAGLAASLAFDGVDINMGCPDESVCKQGAGAALIRTPEAVHELIQEAKLGAAGLPVSVKTRIGYNTNEIETWLPALLSARPAAITIHARTKKEMSKVPARWDFIRRAVEIRNELQAEMPDSDKTLIIGNGDVVDMKDARTKAAEAGCDGVMLGRAIFGNPWLFAHSHESENVPTRPPLPERLRVLSEHVALFDELIGKRKSFAVMKKHFKSYLKGDGASKELLSRLMDAKTATEAQAVLASV